MWTNLGYTVYANWQYAVDTVDGKEIGYTKSKVTVTFIGNS